MEQQKLNKTAEATDQIIKEKADKAVDAQAEKTIKVNNIQSGGSKCKTKKRIKKKKTRKRINKRAIKSLKFLKKLTAKQFR